MKRVFVLLATTLFLSACVSTRSTLQNVDNNAPDPVLNAAKSAFVLSAYSPDARYGFEADYPINVFYLNAGQTALNEKRFLNALAGPKGESINYRKIDQCCPFPTQRTEMGAGYLDVYELTWAGQKTPVKLYLNGFEKGALLVPVGLSIKKEESPADGSKK